MYNNIILPTNTYLAKVLPFIPSNKIIYKFLTGCGATHTEIFCKRWSIIVEPYIPVILGKQWMDKLDKDGNEIRDEDGNTVVIKNPEVLAVYEKTNKDDIVDFLSKPLEKYKLITTPEGMVKIIEACKEIDIDPFDKFFLLVDECEKLIQDANFREDITVVMDYFFSFKERSFISATPIPPSDPRFVENGFEDFFITPEKIDPIKIDLYTTNNIASSIRKYFNAFKNDHYLIFINSTERISSIIKFLKIENESQVFCARESADILKINGIPNASIDWHSSKLKKYNFFTSRFFTAFDLKINCKPNVLIISDFKKVAHSALDPKTDIIQIAGRARNGINHLTHLTNWDAKSTQSEAEVRAYINGLKDGYKMLEQLRDQCNNNHNLGTYDVLNEALKGCKYNNYLNKRTRELCPYLIDNEIQANKVIANYRTAEDILNGYNEADRFEVNYNKENYNLSDESIETLKKGLSRKQTLKIICELFSTYFEQSKEEYSSSPNYALVELIKTHNELYSYYRSLGIERIRELNYSVKQIQREHNLKAIEQSDSYFKLTHTFLLIFREGKCFRGAKISQIMRHYFKKYEIHLRPTITQLRKWFDIPFTRVTLGYDNEGRELKGYRIGEPKNWIGVQNKSRQ